jgi:hypothetical protein
MCALCLFGLRARAHACARSRALAHTHTRCTRACIGVQVDVTQELLNKSTANIEKTILRGYKKAIETGKMDEVPPFPRRERERQTFTGRKVAYRQ